MLCVRLLASLALLISVTHGQIDSPSVPDDAPTAHPIVSKDVVDAPSSIESVFSGQKPQQADNAALIDLDKFNVAEVEDAVELVCIYFDLQIIIKEN